MILILQGAERYDMISIVYVGGGREAKGNRLGWVGSVGGI
jgi:hypothetical protein